MQAQDATTIYLLKLWPWIEENKKAIGIGAAIICVVVFFFWFSSVQHTQKETSAGNAMSQLLVSRTGESSDAYLKIASDYSGTVAAQRATIQAAVLLFGQGKYTDAQAQFQKFIDGNPDSQFYIQALYGNAACLAAENKPQDAIAAYQHVINSSSAGPEVNSSKFAVGGIEESQGRLNDAVTYYEDVASADPSGMLGAEARQRLMELHSQTQGTGASPSSPLQLKR
ncbi:MAG TPA: tetratricopeptide repeat protein [Verrucomicrobiae bacterium]